MDKKHAKQIKRAKKKKKSRKLANEHQQQVSKQMNMFDRIPDKCSACSTAFPKTREAHMSWQVVVYNAQQRVSLFCPECQEKAKKVVEGESNESDT